MVSNTVSQNRRTMMPKSLRIAHLLNFLEQQTIFFNILGTKVGESSLTGSNFQVFLSLVKPDRLVPNTLELKEDFDLILLET